MDREARNDRFTEVEDRFSGYTVYDNNYEKVGTVDDLFVDENDQPEYVGVKTGFFGLNSSLIPFSLVRVNDERQLIEVASDKDTIKNAPNFSDDEEITPDFEDRVYSHFGAERTSADGERGSYGTYYRDDDAEYSETTSTTGTAGNAGAGMTMGDREDGEFREHDPSEEGANERESDLDDRDELRVQRTEEELRAGTREREAGAVNVRKRVRTDREVAEVPTRREEVHVERVPVNEEASGAQIGDDEISVPVVEEEVVVEKRPVVKEELRIRKDVVEDVETVEADVQREEVDVEDATERRRGDL